MNTKSKNIRRTSTIAEQVLAARDALLAARANLKAATAAYYESCNNATFERDDEECQMFSFSCDRVWQYSIEYEKQFPIAAQLHISTNPIFKEMCAAYETKRKARAIERAALRRLLSLGVKRGCDQ